MIELLQQLEQEIKNREISEDLISQIIRQNKDLTNRRIVGGYSSVAITDREGQRIPILALQKAVPRFMANLFARRHILEEETGRG